MTFRETQRRPAGRRRGRGLALGVALTALGVGALWWQRAPLATQLIDRELARRGVPASYAIERLSTGGATLAGVVIGDPAAPDLVASRVQVRSEAHTSALQSLMRNSYAVFCLKHKT